MAAIDPSAAGSDRLHSLVVSRGVIQDLRSMARVTLHTIAIVRIEKRAGDSGKPIAEPEEMISPCSGFGKSAQRHAPNT